MLYFSFPFAYNDEMAADNEDTINAGEESLSYDDNASQTTEDGPKSPNHTHRQSNSLPPSRPRSPHFDRGQYIAPFEGAFHQNNRTSGTDKGWYRPLVIGDL